MNINWLKSQMDKLRAEASRGPVSSTMVFALTDPVMDRIAHEENPRFHSCCGFPADGQHNSGCTFY